MIFSLTLQLRTSKRKRQYRIAAAQTRMRRRHQHRIQPAAACLLAVRILTRHSQDSNALLSTHTFRPLQHSRDLAVAAIHTHQLAELRLRIHTSTRLLVFRQWQRSSLCRNPCRRCRSAQRRIKHRASSRRRGRDTNRRTIYRWILRQRRSLAQGSL